MYNVMSHGGLFVLNTLGNKTFQSDFHMSSKHGEEVTHFYYERHVQLTVEL